MGSEKDILNMAKYSIKYPFCQDIDRFDTIVEITYPFFWVNH